MLSILQKLISRNPVRDMTPPDRKMLGVCLGAAFIFWLILNLSDAYRINKEVEITYLTDPERVLVGTMPQLIEAEVSGQGWNLLWESVRGSSFPITVDVRGRENLRLTRSEVQQRIQRNLSSGTLTVSNLNFDGVTILTTPQEGKRVPVISRIGVALRPGFYAEEKVSFSPDSITINGATDVIAEIDAWPTTELRLEDVGKDWRREIALQTPPDGLEISRSVVEASQSVETFIQRRISVPVQVLNPPRKDSFRIIPEVIELEISVPQSRYDTYTADDFDLTADVANMLSPGQGGNVVPLTLTRRPRGVISVHFEPRSAEFYRYRKD